jgi:phthiodiolone/phenolphthiodiolone dimycocerosates ketoreductase
MAHPKVEVGVGVGTRPPLKRIERALRAARITRFDSAWVVDHLVGFIPDQIWDRSLSWAAGSRESPNAFFDPMTLLGHLATRAGDLRLGVGVTDTIRRHPVALAQSAMTLSHLMRRPPILGLGAGERENIEPYGLSFERPVARLDEAVRIIRTCFSSAGPFEFRGEFWDMPAAVMDLRPVPGRTPELWIGAHGPRMLRLTGTYGDGWYPSLPLRPDEYAAGLATIATAAVHAGRDPAEITPAMHSFMVVGRTEARARAMLAHPGIRFLSLLTPASMWAEAGRRHPFGDEFRGYVDFVPHHHTAAELWDAIELVEPDFVAERVLWGDRPRIVRGIRALAEAGLRHVVLTPVSALVSRSEAYYSVRSMAAIRSHLAEGA